LANAGASRVAASAGCVAAAAVAGTAEAAAAYRASAASALRMFMRVLLEWVVASCRAVEQHGVLRRVDHFADERARAPLLPVRLLHVVLRRLEPHVAINVDHRHHRARLLRAVGAGAVEGPAQVEADF